jgi:Domain of unknown function (DUF4136)
MRAVNRKVVRWAVAAVLCGTLVSCATLKTSVAWDEKADFRKYKTWAWKDDGSIRDPVWNRRVQSVLEDELARHGLTRVEANPNLWVVVHARLDVQTRVDYYSPAWGYGYGYWATPSMAVVSEVPVGMMIFDLVDVEKKELVWRATARDTIRAGKENEEREQRLIGILGQLFAGYPPAPGASGDAGGRKS